MSNAKSKKFSYFAHSGKPFMIQSKGGNAFVHVHGGGTANGTNISTWSYVDQDNLKWYLKPAEHAGYFYIVSALDRNHDHVLHQHGGTNGNGDNITLWDRCDQGNTQVRFENAGDGYYNIVFRHSNKAVHVHGGGTANDTNITQWDVVNQDNLKWRLVKTNQGGYQKTSHHGWAHHPKRYAKKGKVVFIQSKAGNAYVHVHGGGTANGTNISAWSHVNQDNLKWRVKPAEEKGWFYIVTALDPNHDRVLHQHGGTQGNGDNITLWERVNQGNTQVRFEDAGDGFFYIIFKHSGKCVHLHGGGTANDTNITQWEKVNQDNLKWRFVKA